MSNSNFVVMEDGASLAGAVVWWSLSGGVDYDELDETLGYRQETWPMPAQPSPEVSLLRAARQQVKTKRQNVRPGFVRGTYVFLTEHPGADEKSIVVENQLYLSVTYNDEMHTYNADPETDSPQQVQDRDELSLEILKNCRIQERLLDAADISAWLLSLLTNQIGAVGLRERGGFYFIPRDRLEDWKELTTKLSSVSSHRFFQIPALRTEEAVEAILVATRSELQEKLAEVETYLAGKVSTRGLNAYERELEALQAKSARYAEILGVSLDDIQAKGELLSGNLTAARLMVGEDKAVA